MTTDNGSNNFTMAKHLQSVLAQGGNAWWNSSAQHHRCFCHVLALILGAGLKKLNLSEYLAPETRRPTNFPTLETIQEEEDADDGQDEVSDSSVDQADAEAPSSSGEADDEDDLAGGYAEHGIGFTLKKVS